MIPSHLSYGTGSGSRHRIHALQVITYLLAFGLAIPSAYLTAQTSVAPDAC